MAHIKERLLASSILIAGLGLYFPVYQQIYKLSIKTLPQYLAAKVETPRTPCNRKKHMRHGFPHQGSQIGKAISPNRKKIYQLTNNGIKVFNRKTNQHQRFDLPNNFPPLSWGTDLAYDSKRNLVSVVSFGGEGYLYRFDAKNNRWLDVQSLHNLDLKSLAYDQSSDRYVAWAEDYGQGGKLVFISATGKLLFQQSISDRLAGFDQLYQSNNEMSPVVEIIPRGNRLTLITYTKHAVPLIWYYDLISQEINSPYQTGAKSKLSRSYAD